MRGLEKKDPRALAKAVTLAESGDEGAAALMNHAYRNMSDKALILGVTGPGGAGKSTLIDKLIRHFRWRGLTVGVIAVDPTSPYTGGAFLGDRVRMSAHNADQGVFIRSLGSRGALGGISAGAQKCLYLFKNYDFDVIIVESLGVGQDETEITNFVDVTIVALVPGFGDSIQMAKAGLQEIADIFVVNKADRPDAEEFYLRMLESLHSIPEDMRPQILKTAAADDRGVAELADIIMPLGERQRLKRAAKTRIRVRSEIETEVLLVLRQGLGAAIEERAEAVCQGRSTPFEAALEIMERLSFKY